MNPEKYDVVYADPPWHFSQGLVSSKRDETGAKTARRLEEFHYDTMSHDDLKMFFATTVKDLAADPAVLIMWTTDAHLEEAITLGKLAGFDYKTVAFIWNKKTVTGKQVCFMGSWTMKGSEIALLFTKPGAHKLLKSRKVRQLVEAERREHSRKPDEVRHRIEDMFPNTRKLELFARSSPVGWDVLGNETEKFFEAG